MRVKLRTIAAGAIRGNPGDVVEVADEVGQDLVDSHQADPVDAAPAASKKPTRRRGGRRAETATADQGEQRDEGAE